MAAAERVLLPCLRAMPLDTLVLATDSAAEQIEQWIGAQPVHIAEAVACLA
jgi:hypothetical protein